MSIGTRYAFPKLMYDSVQKSLVGRTAREESLAQGRLGALGLHCPRRSAPASPRSPNTRTVAPIDSLKQKRPPVGMSMVIRTVGLVQLGQRYAITMSGVRMLDGRIGSPQIRILTTQKPPTPAEIAKAKADSAKAKVKTDSLARLDSIKKATRPDTVHSFRLR